MSLVCDLLAIPVIFGFCAIMNYLTRDGLLTNLDFDFDFDL